MTRQQHGDIFYSAPFIRMITKLCAGKNLTLDELAVRAGVRRCRLARCERGIAEPHIEDVLSVAKALEVSPLWLFNKVLADGNAARAIRRRGYL